MGRPHPFSNKGKKWLIHSVETNIGQEGGVCVHATEAQLPVVLGNTGCGAKQQIGHC